MKNEPTAEYAFPAFDGVELVKHAPSEKDKATAKWAKIDRAIDEGEPQGIIARFFDWLAD